MPQWRVRDVMTGDVITARDDTSYAEIAAILREKRISAVPIVDRFDVVVGVVSWTDLYDKIDAGGPDPGRTRWWHRWTAPRLRWPAGSAVEVMSSPAVTVGPDVSLPTAARTMYRRNVGRLLVVDDDGRLRGIVSRSDLLKVYGRMDEVIRDDVLHRVLHRTLMVEPGAVHVVVDEGVVTLTGRIPRRTTARAAARLAGTVAGVTDVVDRLTFDLDDTVASVGRAKPADRDPFGGHWVGRRLPSSVGRGGTRRSTRTASQKTGSGVAR